MHVKFTLPVGALVNGWRHLGNGEFCALDPNVVDEMSGAHGVAPDLIEGEIADGAAWPERFKLERFNDPLRGVSTKLVISKAK